MVRGSKKAGGKAAGGRKASKKPPVKKGSAKNAEAKPLPPRRQKFVDNYIANGGNGRKAAEDAGFAPGHGAETEAWRLLRNAEVRKVIQTRQAEANVEKAEIIGTLASHMRGDLTDLLYDGDEIRELARSRGVSHLIKKLKRKTRYYSNGPSKDPDKEVTYEFEMYSAQEAARQLCTVFGLNKLPSENPVDLARKALAEAEVRYPHLDRAVLAKLAAETYDVQESDLIQ
jgi:hypothetical protein